MVSQPRNRVRSCMIAIPAVLCPISIVNNSIIIRVFSAFEKFFHKVNSIVKIVIIHITAVDVNFSLKFGTQCLPVSLQDVTKVIILTPVFSHGMIDFACQFVPDRFWIAILTNRRINCLPDIPLVT